MFSRELCEFGDPVFAYVGPSTKASAKWRRMIFLGKADIQNSYVLFDGQAIVLSRSVRRISTTWKSHMAFYSHYKCFSWQYKAGFGSRILPTMKKPVPKAVGFDVPLGPIGGNKLFDEEAEAVIQFAEQEEKAEREQAMMFANAPISLALRKKLGERAAAEMMGDSMDDGPAMPMSSAPLQIEAPSPPRAVQDVDDPGLVVPVTPPMEYVEIDSPSAEETAYRRSQETEG